ncbi:uncharacterized protein A4U43_C01F32090 [Asparagus officinalis]|uniref:Glutaredoxin domain-containing protein n=1 Tax=Asparagus officinalis TaxID=4686 RepID=A0A5P1FX81_ASPOF|nr:uncharacterized protein At3g28850 [Asparagus officinalis]ONK81710.1 uncharacterized protein A4U43_C01F32090 [Asparagus officinalis]
MGCISSKFLAASDLDRKISAHHVVSLTSTTYGALNLDHKQEEEKAPPPKEEVEKQICTTKVTKISPSPLPSALLFTPQSKKRVAAEEPSEIIDTWELMKDLSDEIPIWSPAMRPAKSQATDSPKKQRRRLLSKENNSPRDFSPRQTPNPNRVLRPFSSSANRQPSKLVIDVKSPKVLEKDWGNAGSRRSLSPLFDPELVASFEKELKKEGEQIKKTVPKKPNSSSLLLEKFEEKCPPSGGNALILYSTTLRGIRKTFEDCNVVRNLIEGYDVRIIERDISMDSGFREELRVLMGKEEARPPLLFVKGRLIGGAEEVLKLEEEGNLGTLLEGIDKKEVSGCGFCGGMRFVMCRECNGSCKVLDEEEKKMVKCEECNENGLIHCPLCC